MVVAFTWFDYGCLFFLACSVVVVVECCDCVVACFLVAEFVWFVLVYNSLFCGCVDDLVLFGYLCFGSMLQGGVLF